MRPRIETVVEILTCTLLLTSALCSLYRAILTALGYL